MEQSMSHSDGICMVCGDKSAGKHYGILACYGCKGFFRRSIRSGSTYTCRFMQKCSIDKDQRNACRYCRFRRCLEVGMEPDAIRPDRDVIGKQKNPRKRKFKRGESCELSPEAPVEAHGSQQEDTLLNYLVDIERTRRQSEQQYAEMFGIGISALKAEPDTSLIDLFENHSLLDSFRISVKSDGMRTASVEQLSEAMRGYAIAAIDWINSLFQLAGIQNSAEKCSILKNSFAPFAAFQKATNTAIMCAERETLCLCNGGLLPRNLPRHLLDTNLLANNMVGRILDELVRPIRRLQLQEAERVALATLILLDGDNCGCSFSTSDALATVRDKVQNALFQFIRERCEHSLSTASTRFANILLLLPSIAKVSALYHENFQLAKMFGVRSVDPLLEEILLDSTTDPQPQSVLSPTTRLRSDAATQTAVKVDEVIESAVPATSCMSNSSTASALSSVGSTVDESLDSMLSLSLEMQRAAQVKAEANNFPVPKPFPLVMPPHDYAFFEYSHGFSDAFNNNNNTPNGHSQSAGLPPATHFDDFYEHPNPHSQPPVRTPTSASPIAAVPPHLPFKFL